MSISRSFLQSHNPTFSLVMAVSQWAGTVYRPCWLVHVEKSVHTAGQLWRKREAKREREIERNRCVLVQLFTPRFHKTGRRWTVHSWEVFINLYCMCACVVYAYCIIAYRCRTFLSSCVLSMSMISLCVEEEEERYGEAEDDNEGRSLHANQPVRHTHTHTQTKYHNPCCVCAPRVNEAGLLGMSAPALYRESMSLLTLEAVCYFVIRDTYM